MISNVNCTIKSMKMQVIITSYEYLYFTRVRLNNLKEIPSYRGDSDQHLLIGTPRYVGPLSAHGRLGVVVGN